MSSKLAQESTVKFLLNLFVSILILSVLITCIGVSGKLILGDIPVNILQDTGLFFIVAVVLCFTSASIFFLYVYFLELRIAISTYRFYKALTGQGSFRLLTESYYTTIKTFNTPIHAKHTDGSGNIIAGVWNGVGDWSVYDKKQTRKFTGET